jgi:hypothetical protein
LQPFHSRLILMPALQLRKLPLRKLPPTDYNHKYGW